MPLLQQYWYLLVLGAVLLAAAVTDLRSGRIPNWVTYPAVLVGLAGHTLAGGWGGSQWGLGLGGALLGTAVGFLPLFVAWRAGGIGGGDAKLMAAVGSLAGWEFALVSLMFGLAVAVIMAFGVMVRRRIVKQTLLRVGRFVYLAFTPARPADPATTESPKIAFGLALCIGAALALAQVLLGWGAATNWLIGH